MCDYRKQCAAYDAEKGCDKVKSATVTCFEEPLTTQKAPVADVPLQCGVMCDGYFKGITEEAIKILGEYLPPDGIDSKETLSRLLGIFDNKEIVERLKRT